ncbi:TrkH family potassium uptake protein [Desulfitobacterium metallireducens]|uniref:V-type sodium ATP synthase subunit J n=1 Tax=Desulfitobacterium metallireducens DSM 15288 TaxID=871968 RepID=W0E644_9FIRM|nr:TrkH family potassium uptake protein [Desulfitobacterium metallireducens]AHF06340.1 V-type sodium ATP synthase subunit J [Desulfitobacterium metallireducens DSM 15288]
MDRFFKNLTPPRVLVIGFAIVILLGALILTLPVATVDGQGLKFLNALFTATSAVCVTGLIVVDTGTTFTLFGQLVILSLIQIGGLGFMTFATFFAIILGRKVTLKERLLLQEALNQVSLEGVVRLAKYVLQVTFAIEAAGALILAVRWSFDMSWTKAIYYGIFHAVSSFNNAGFDLFGEYSSITRYVGDPIVNITIMLLIIFGGLGFTVLSDLYMHKGKKMMLHTKMVLSMTGILIFAGAILIFLIEFSNPKTLGSLDPMAKILSSLFQSVTARTAGYNTLDMTGLRSTTLLIMIILMFIGASPGSTGGGIKTTTFASVSLYVFSLFRGESFVTFKERSIATDVIQKAVAVVIMALVLVLVVTGVLTLTEKADFLTLLFETTSAFATVGLTVGLTPTLTNMGKLMIIFTMFAGRVGPLTLVFALSHKRNGPQQKHIKYPEEKIMIG